MLTYLKAQSRLYESLRESQKNFGSVTIIAPMSAPTTMWAYGYHLFSALSFSSNSGISACSLAVSALSFAVVAFRLAIMEAISIF